MCACMQERDREREITYFHPTIWPQEQQNISATVCIPESINLSSEAPTVMFTLKYKLHPITSKLKSIHLDYDLLLQI